LGGSFLLGYKLPKGKITLNSFYNRQSNDGHTRRNNIFNIQNGRVGNNLDINEGTTEIITSGLSYEQDFGWIKIDGGVSRTSSLKKIQEITLRSSG